MIPLQGLISDVIGIVALFKLWRHPLPGLWWGLLVLMIVNVIGVKALRLSISEYGMFDGSTKVGTVFCMVVQFSIIGLGIYAFAR